MLRSALLVLALLMAAPSALAQDDGPSRADLPDFMFDPSLYGTRTAEKTNIHDGNEIAISFFNYGLFGGAQPAIRGNWPKGSRDFYVGDVQPIVAMEVPYPVGSECEGEALVVNTVTSRGPRAGSYDQSDDGQTFYGFEAKPGFAFEGDIPTEGGPEPNESPAISTDPRTWPRQWPSAPLWPAQERSVEGGEVARPDWNGYFGRGQFSADLESYFWMDDNQDEEVDARLAQQQLEGIDPDYNPACTFAADSTDFGRGGQGLEVSVRGMQWSQFLAQDVLFVLYEVTNRSTTTYPRVATGLTVGTLAGGDNDSHDDLAFFDQANRIVYSWDSDNSGNEGQDVGYVGYGFLESPGDDNNGIDDDGDGDPLTDLGEDVDGLPFVPMDLAGSDNTFDQQDFQPRTLAAGDPLVAIDEETGARSYFYVPASGELTFTTQGREVTVRAGDVVQEAQTVVTVGQDENEITERNFLDEDFDGLIDEDADLHFERRAQNLQGDVVTLPSVRFMNYVGFAEAIEGRAPTRQDSLTYGLLNPMIDEARDDGIDNDGDWSAADDDVGRDGLAGTGDEGEGDGIPTPGEPNFDDTDVDESDQVGLTSFYYFEQLSMSQDETIWQVMQPGYFTTNERLREIQGQSGIDGDFIFGSGYYEMPPGKTLRFTMALIFGDDLQDITNNAVTAQEIYDRNYQFARPPDTPTLSAVPGDGQVTLYWDNAAELSEDPILGQDFEGYKLYRSTDPYFRDPTVVTDAFGSSALSAPIAQYDLTNGVEGIWPLDVDVPPIEYPRDATFEDSVRVEREYRALLEELLGSEGAAESLVERTRGTPFFLGSDTGLRHTYVDTLVDNGRRYYYAVTAYDRGSFDFYPAENNFQVSVAQDGTVTAGQNVVEVIPNAPVPGYEGGVLTSDVERVAGATTGDVFVEVLDPRRVPEDGSYRVTFTSPSPLRADSFFVHSAGDTLAAEQLGKAGGAAFDGMRLAFNNPSSAVDLDATGYVAGDTTNLVNLAASRIVINQSDWIFSGTGVPYDYEIRFADAPVDDALHRSLGGALGESPDPIFGPPAVEARPTNISVYNTTLDRPAAFAFFEQGTSADPNDVFDAQEQIFIYECPGAASIDACSREELVPTYIVRLSSIQERDDEGNILTSFPGEGDVFEVVTQKAITPRDAFAFSTRGEQVEVESDEDALDRVRVVPNPYVAAASWERPLPPTVTTGRGERRILFTHVPANSRIRIYTARGDLVRELRHDSPISDGTVEWNLRTRENLDVAYGVYFYHLEAPGVGETTGKIAIIK